MFLFGEAVCDQFLGIEPGNIDMDSNCETETLYNVCKKVWAEENCKRSNACPVIHIGDPNVLKENVDEYTIRSLLPRTENSN